MSHGQEGRVWGLIPYVDYWLAERWTRLTSTICSPLAAVSIPAFVATDCSDPGVAPDRRIVYALVARYGNIAIWEISIIRLALVKPTMLLTGCLAYDWTTINWDLSVYSAPPSAYCDPLCLLGSEYLEDAGRLIFMTVKPEMQPHVMASECWEYVVAIGNVAHTTDPADFAPSLLSVHQPDMAFLGGVTPTDFFHTSPTVGALKNLQKGSKLV